ncbi:MAG: hypothetical protein ACP5JO_00830 [Candidatus Ratteibacteria bacterium]
MKKSVSIIWKNGKHVGTVEVKHGVLSEIRVDGKTIEGRNFSFDADGKIRLDIIVEWQKKPGHPGPLVHVFSTNNPFSFFVSDVNENFPVFVPEYSVIVTSDEDRRTYDEIEHDIKKKNGLSKLKQMELEEEQDYETAERKVRKLKGPVWLGISRDIRIFEIIFPDPDRITLNIVPKYHGYGVKLSEFEKLDENAKRWSGNEILYSIHFGRGSGCSQELERYLEDRRIPILCGKLEDQDIVYDFVMFVSTEIEPLTLQNLRGTHFLVADGFGIGHMFTKEQQNLFDNLVGNEINREQENVLFLQITAINRGNAPAYAFFKTPATNLPLDFLENGMTFLSDDRVCSVSMLDGNPLHQEEFSLLLYPGQKSTVDIRIFHKPVSIERAKKLMQKSFEEKITECRNFWNAKIQQCAEIKLPEKRIEDMIYAGILHLDMIAYGIEPDKPVSACIGRYCPIGSESAPIIQFFDTMSWHKLAERSLLYFVEKQHEDGFMQNFSGYMLETGAALWCMGEHFRYTRDKTWVRKIKPCLLKAVDYIGKWIEKNRNEKFKGICYGMIDGKVADPEDHYHIFMLNGYAYLGLKRAAEMLSAIKETKAKETNDMAEELKKNIRESFFSAMARSPVVPLGDGTWVPTAPPWPQHDGLLVHYADRGKWFTHGTFLGRDSMLGPLYLIFQEVLDPHEQASDFLVKYHTEHFYKRNVAFSQPYYSRHPEIHLMRGEIHSFLKAYYNCFPALIDRETGSFWEHFFYASPHKTHEEAWFLMETRWMLCMEKQKTLCLLPGIPRKWMKDGSNIIVKGLATYFGKLSLRVKSDLKNKKITAEIFCEGKPENVEIRIPHPEKLLPEKVIGGKYIKEKETVVVEKFRDKAEVILFF